MFSTDFEKLLKIFPLIKSQCFDYFIECKLKRTIQNQSDKEIPAAVDKIKRKSAREIRPKASDSADKQINYRTEESEAKAVNSRDARPDESVIDPPEKISDKREQGPNVDIHNDPSVKAICHRLDKNKHG